MFLEWVKSERSDVRGLREAVERTGDHELSYQLSTYLERLCEVQERLERRMSA